MRKVGKHSKFKRLKTKDGKYGYTDSSTNNNNSTSNYLVYLDDGSTFSEKKKIVETAIERCRDLNARTWYVLEPERNIKAGRPDAITAEGMYPVYAAKDVVSYKYDLVLQNEFKWLQSRYKWDVYHDSEGKGQFASGVDRYSFTSSQTNVRTLYGVKEYEKMDLPVQNPCGLPMDMQWSENKLSDPFVPMPPATKRLRDLIAVGNPSVTRIFHNVVGMSPYYLACAAYTDYHHNTDVGGALAWHFDKALGVETMCVSVTPPNSKHGSKTIGLGGYPPRIEMGKPIIHVNAAKTYETMKVLPRSIWSCNAKAIYHAVGNDTPRSYTIVIRTYIRDSS